MKINTRFSINDKVYHISRQSQTKWEICPACKGEGYLQGQDDKRYRCPECYGKGGKNIYQALEWLVSNTFTIGQVQVEVTNLNTDGRCSNMGHYKKGGDKQETKYMVYETGVGSGNLYKEEDLFHTIDEAKTECEKRNASED